MALVLTPLGRVADLVDRARAEYRDMPGTCLTLSQACRLWTAERTECRVVLDQLVTEGFLCLCGDAYTRVDKRHRCA